MWPWYSGNTSCMTSLFYRIFEDLSKMIFKYSNKKYSNIWAKNIRIFESKIFEYPYSVHCSITNIFVFVFGPKSNIRYALGHNRSFYNGHYGHLDHLADMISLNMFTNMLLLVSMERMWITSENGIEKMHRIESYD